MKVERLIANDPEDCRGLINTLVTNGYVVWMTKVFDVEGRKTNTVVFYAPWRKRHLIDESISALPTIGPDFLEEIRKVWSGYYGVYTDDLEPEDEPEPDESEPEKPADPMYQCPKEIDGRQCVLSGSHAGDCLVKCDDPNCPGYAWAATKDRPHPTNTCKGKSEKTT